MLANITKPETVAQTNSLKVHIDWVENELLVELTEEEQNCSGLWISTDADLEDLRLFTPLKGPRLTINDYRKLQLGKRQITNLFINDDDKVGIEIVGRGNSNGMLLCNGTLEAGQQWKKFRQMEARVRALLNRAMRNYEPQIARLHQQNA